MAVWLLTGHLNLAVGFGKGEVLIMRFRIDHAVVSSDMFSPEQRCYCDYVVSRAKILVRNKNFLMVWSLKVGPTQIPVWLPASPDCLNECTRSVQGRRRYDNSFQACFD